MDENAHKQPNRWKNRIMQNKGNASNVEQPLACMDVKSCPVFELCEGLIEYWQDEVQELNASCPRKALSVSKTFDIMVVDNLSDTLTGLNTADEKSNDFKLTTNIYDLKSKVGIKFNSIIATYQETTKRSRMPSVFMQKIQ